MKSLYFKITVSCCVVFLNIYIFQFRTASAQELYVQKELKPYYEMYLDESKERGFDFEPYINNRLDSLSLDYDLRYPALGICFLINNVVFISGDYLDYTDILKASVFHELTHVLQKDTEYACSRCFNLEYKDEELNAISPSFRYHITKDYGMNNLDSLFKRVSIDLKNQLGEE